MEQAKEKKDRLPLLRQRLNDLLGDMSTTDFAKKVGISRQTMGFYLNGDRIPDAAILQQICAACNVSSDWLLGLTNDPNRQPCATDELGLSMNAVNAVKSIGALEDADDILAGLNIILEGCNMVFISREAKKLREKIQAECAYTDSQLYKAASRHRVPLSSSQSLLIQDMDLIDSLICELQDAHPELKDRLFTIFCGQTAIDMTFQTIAESFTTELKMATGYFDYIAKTMGNK